jgi:hypothetical protein
VLIVVPPGDDQINRLTESNMRLKLLIHVTILIFKTVIVYKIIKH